MLAKNARELAASGLPVVMAGDFNATPWSAGWSVVQQAGLSRATPLRPTWPAHAGIPALIPIDHIAASAHWVVRNSRRGPAIGSDHFPVEAVLALRQ
jgi:endonuclease/exonuclease/phosphatase (EEP) superfamily protein YafD